MRSAVHLVTVAHGVGIMDCVFSEQGCGCLCLRKGDEGTGEESLCKVVALSHGSGLGFRV